MPPLAALLLLLSVAPALAARAPALAWPGPEVVAGQVIELAWGTPPAGVEELEILLSLDDGRAYAVRVSPELDASERRYVWRVPNLPAAHARLRMRLGSEHGEFESDPTASFRIVGSDAEPAPRRLVLERPLWTGFEPLGSGDRGMLSPATRMDAAGLTITIAEAPARPSALRPAPAAPAPGCAAVASAPAARPTLATRHPRLTPLRI